MPGILPRPAVAFRLILRPQGWPGGRGCGGVLQGGGPVAGVVAVSCRESARPGGILPGGLSRLRWPLAPAARVAVAEGIGPESGRVSRLRLARWLQKAPEIGRILAQSGAISYKAAGGGPARGYSSQLIEATTR